ncbi:MAG: hypothetical protein IKD43_04975 [Clostridia bacterium]|nr:hypothetical protein [Clostridia bacterium]
MTKRLCYHASMILLSVQWMGALYAAMIFAICFLAVHFFKLAKMGYLAYRIPQKKEEEREPKEEKPEPVYYIEEKKKKRAKATYSEPKRIHFKDQ